MNKLTGNREKLEYCREIIIAIRDSHLSKAINITPRDPELGKAFFSEAEWLDQALKDTKPEDRRNG